MVKTHKSQHYVPKSYLSACCDPNTPKNETPYVWTFARDGGVGRKKAPANLFTETDMYTIPLPDGGRDLRIEHGLSQLEKGLNQLRKNFIDKQRQLPTPRFVRLIAFIAAMHSRTKSFRDHHRKQWQRVLDIGDDMLASMATKSPEERARIARTFLPGSGKTMSTDDVKNIMDMPVQLMLAPRLSTEVPILSQMVMTIYCTINSPGFITSDNPVVWFDPESENRPLMYQAPALMHKSLEITMPLSPRHLLAIHHDQPISRGIKPVQYIDAWEETVIRMNRRIVLHASETVVSCSDGYDADWSLL